MKNKNIDWQGTVANVVVAIALVNILMISSLQIVVSDDFGSMEYRIIVTIIVLLGMYQQANIVMYEG